MRVTRIVGTAFLLVLLGFAGAVWAYSSYAVYETRLDAWPDREVGATAPQSWEPSNPGRVRILSLDGGGIRGLVTLEVLKYLEETSGKPIAELFDVVAGTSTGAIIGTRLLMADEQGRPSQSASDIIELYDRMVARVFQVPWYHELLTVRGLFGPRFINQPKIEVAQEIYGDANFRDLLLPTMIPSYSVEEGKLELFNNWSSRQAEMLVAPLIAAATSVPSWFPGIELTGLPEDTGVYMDGATLGNAPSLIALLQSLNHLPDRDILMVSIGTGHTRLGQSFHAGTRGGLVEWLGSLAHIGVAGHASLVTSWLRDYSQTKVGEGFTFYRFDKVAPPDMPGIADTSPEASAYLKRFGESLVAENKDTLDRVIQELTGQ